MKYLNLFENTINSIWIVVSIPLDSSVMEYELAAFYDEKSAENYYIDFVNNVAKSDSYYNKGNTNDTIFTLDDAEKYVLDNQYLIEYRKINIHKNYDLPENLIIGKQTKKYNL